MKPKSGHSPVFVRVIATFFLALFEVEINFSLQHFFPTAEKGKAMPLSIAFSLDSFY